MGHSVTTTAATAVAPGASSVNTRVLSTRSILLFRFVIFMVSGLTPMPKAANIIIHCWQVMKLNDAEPVQNGTIACIGAGTGGQM